MAPTSSKVSRSETGLEVHSFPTSTSSLQLLISSSLSPHTPAWASLGPLPSFWSGLLHLSRSLSPICPAVWVTMLKHRAHNVTPQFKLFVGFLTGHLEASKILPLFFWFAPSLPQWRDSLPFPDVEPSCTCPSLSWELLPLHARSCLNSLPRKAWCSGSAPPLPWKKVISLVDMSKSYSPPLWQQQRHSSAENFKHTQKQGSKKNPAYSSPNFNPQQLKATLVSCSPRTTRKTSNHFTHKYCNIYF